MLSKSVVRGALESSYRRNRRRLRSAFRAFTAAAAPKRPRRLYVATLASSLLLVSSRKSATEPRLRKRRGSRGAGSDGQRAAQFHLAPPKRVATALKGTFRNLATWQRYRGSVRSGRP